MLPSDSSRQESYAQHKKTGDLREERISAAFAEYRHLYTNEVEHWVKRFTDLCHCGADVSVLDIGCGTGRFAYILALYLGCIVHGLDISAHMLGRAATNTLPKLRWIRGNAEELPFKASSFDMTFMSMVIEHIVNKEKAVFEAYRVLRVGGRIAIRMCDRNQLARTSWYRWFPTALEIDMAKMPAPEHVSKILDSAGFEGTLTYKFDDKRVERSSRYIARLKNKAYSALWLVPSEQFRSGISALEEELSLTRYFHYTSPCTLVISNKLRDGGN